MILEVVLVNMAPVIIIPIILMSLIYAYSKSTANNSLESLVKTEFSEYVLFIILFVVLFSFITSSLFIDILGYLEDYVFNKVQDNMDNKPDPLFISEFLQEKGSGSSSVETLRGSSLNSLENVETLLVRIINDHLIYLRDVSSISSLTATAQYLSASSDRKPPESDTLKDIVDNLKSRGFSGSSYITIPQCRGYYAAVNYVNSYSFYIGSALMAIEFQRILLNMLSSDRAVTVILAIGFLLRSNPSTRGMGAFFLALGLGLYTIMPFSILIMNDLLRLYFYSINVNDITPLKVYSEHFLDFGGLLIPDSNGLNINRLLGTVSAGSSFLSAGVLGRGVGCAPTITERYQLHLINYEDNKPLSNLSYLASFGFFVILAQALVLLTFVSIVGGIAKAFGAEISPYVIGRLTYYLRS